MDRFRRQPDRNGVTLFELMAVLVIVGILGVIAVPAYNRYIERARVSEAQTRLGDIMTSAKVWAQEHDEMWPEEGDVTTSRLFVMTSSQHFDFDLGTGAGNSAEGPLTITATGIGGQRMAGWSVDITVNSINHAAVFVINEPGSGGGG